MTGPRRSSGPGDETTSNDGLGEGSIRVVRIAWATGLSVDEVATYLAGQRPPAIDRRISLAARLDPDTSAILQHNLTTYAQFANLLKDESDWAFAVRVLRQCALTAARLTRQDDIDAFHAEPSTTGYVGWDAALAGVAVMTGRDRVSSPAILEWVSSPSRRVVNALFDPLDSGKYIWLEALRTPVELRERNVVLARGNLEGI
ncbi:MAG: hypothetical protein ACJA07_001538 [Rhodococcus sp. (in: high G+C Gram-positive bacteria)]|jgi:hypothetical protein